MALDVTFGQAQNPSELKTMESVVTRVLGLLATLVDASTGVAIALGVFAAIFRAARVGLQLRTSLGSAMSEIRLTLGRWLALALELALAADILRTVMLPTWDEIGKLAAIVVLRTVLNYFLQKEMSKSKRRGNMLSKLLPDFLWFGQALQILSALVIVAFACAALISLARHRGTNTARLLVAEGVIGGLGLMTAATL